MGILQADLNEYLKSYRRLPPDEEKTASPLEETDVLDVLKISLERYAGACASLTKEASDDDHQRLYLLHGAVEDSYAVCAKFGKRPEANELLDKFSGWTYLKGCPKKRNDWTPLPVPEEDS